MRFCVCDDIDDFVAVAAAGHIDDITILIMMVMVMIDDDDDHGNGDGWQF